MATYIVKDGNLELAQSVGQSANQSLDPSNNISVSVPIGQEVEVITMDKSRYIRTYNPVTPKPSLLRRARPSVSKPQRMAPYTGGSITASTLPPASAGFIQRNTVVTLPPVQTQPPESTVEEIVLWEPDTEDVEIVEVDESELEQLFQQRQQPNTNIQQIIVCDGENVPFTDFLQNYYLEVVQNPNLQEKQKRPKPEKKKAGVDLKCLEEECPNITHNVIDLRKHLQEDHNFEFEEEHITFTSDEAFKTWRTSYERERRVSFIYRGGTKKISAEKAVTYLICHRSGYYKPTVGPQAQRKRKLKPQGSCKIGTHCTAGIKLLKSLTTGIIDATICHTHYGHDNENIQHLRVNPIIKKLVLDKLGEGFSFRQLLEYVHHNPDGLQGMGVVDRRAIRNIFDQWRRTNDDNMQISESAHSSTDSFKKGCPQTVVKVEEREIDTVVENEVKGDECSDDVQENELNSIDETDKETKSEVNLDDSEASGSKTEIINKIEKITSEIIKSEVSELKENTSISESENNFTDEENNMTEKNMKKQAKLKKNIKPKRSKPLPAKEPPEDVHITIQKLLRHGDSGPTVLFYKKSGETETAYGEESGLVTLEDLCIIVQTPIQRQLLQMNGKIVNVEIIEGYDMDLMVVSILDEFLTSVPVAWMITSHMSVGLVEHCFRILQKNCIQIKCQYLITPKKNEFLPLWAKVFQRLPKLILPQEDTLKEFRNLIRRHLDNQEKRVDVIKLLEEMVTTPDVTVFEEALKTLKATANISNFLKAMNKDWLPIKAQWSFHKRSQIHTAVEEAFMRLRKFILFKGTKKMKQNIHNILKIGYDRCFQRSKSLFKGDLKIQYAVDEIQAKHGASGVVEKIGNKYTVDSTYEVFDLETACTCRVRCEQCEVCMHNYWCSCGDRNFCAHAHTVRQFCVGNFIVKSEEDSDAEVLTVHSASSVIPVEVAEDENMDDEAHSMREKSSSPELIIPEKSEPTKRISARIRRKGKSRQYDSDDDEEQVEEEDELPKAKKGRGRPRKVFVPSSSQKLTSQSNSIKTHLTPSTSESVTRKESVREELLGLLGKLDNIHDARVMTEVKKRISDISAVVHLGLNGQI